MDLKSIIGKTQEKKESFWALLLEPGWISAAIWEVQGEEVNIVSQGSSAAWSNEDDLIGSVDTALSSCITGLPQDYEEPEKTVFGLPSSWIEDGNIKPENLEKLKKICEDLSLKPSGFVVLSEAVAHLVKANEGSPLSGITVGVSEKSLEITLFKLGKKSGVFEVSRSVSIVDDLVEGLVRFGTDEVFPSRIVVYDGKDADLEDVRSSLSDATWDSIEKIKFLHTPKVDIISPSEKVTAVCLAGGSEIAGVTKVAGKQEPVESKIPDDVQNISKPKINLTAQDLGFIQGDIKVLPQPPQPQSLAKEEVSVKKKFNFKLPKLNLPKPKIKLPGTSSKRSLMVGGVSLLTFLILGFVFWWFYPVARVIVFVSPKKLDETLEITLGTDLSFKEVSEEVSGEKTKSTTGTKLVGEKSTGTVRIQNGTATVINLDVGTIISSSTDIKFELEKSASISAALSPSSPGVATVEVKAYDIGSEYNLAKDEVFKIGNYPKADVDAVSTDDFSGGSSRQISAVSEEDQVDLEESLIDELVDRAKEAFSEKISLEELLIESSLSTEIDTSDFSNNVGDETSTLKLSISLKVTGRVVSKSDLIEKTTSVLTGKIPTGFVLRDDQLTFKFTPDEENLDKFEVGVSVNLLPNVDTEEVAKKVVGKYPELAREYLSSVPGFIRAEFKIKPLFPGKLGTLPHVVKRIEVEVSAD